jgi:hypothetical protein
MRLIGFVLAAAVWLFVVTYAYLAVTMGGCTAPEPGCDPQHTADIATVAVVALAGFAAIVWWFLLRRRKS